MVPAEKLQGAMVALGFTELEAEVYTFLLRESPATGYRIAQALGRPVAGVYKAIPSMAEKGALLLDDGGSRLCRAVPPEELLAGMERRFQQNRAAAADALAELRGTPADDRIYELRSLEQVLERCRAMLARAERVAVVDGIPGNLERLRPEIEAAAARGVRVGAISYGPAEFSGARTASFPAAHPVTQSLPGSWLIVVVDAAELLLAFLAPDGNRLLQAVWSSSPYLAWALQGFTISEFNFLAAMHDPEMPPEAEEIARRHGAFFSYRLDELPGYQRLLQRLELPVREAPLRRGRPPRARLPRNDQESE